jgi:hypothetical protein
MKKVKDGMGSNCIVHTKFHENPSTVSKDNWGRGSRRWTHRHTDTKNISLLTK